MYLPWGGYRKMWLAGSCSQPGAARLDSIYTGCWSQDRCGKARLYTGCWSQNRCSKAWRYTGCWSQVKLTGGWPEDGVSRGLGLLLIPANTPGGGGEQLQLAKHCLLPLNCTGAQSVLNSFLIGVWHQHVPTGRNWPWPATVQAANC